MVIALVVMATALTVGSFAWVLRRQRRRNSIGAGRPPLSWQYAPGEVPRLHRRLLNAVECARRAGSGSEMVRSLARELEHEAARLDDALVMVGRLPARRRVAAIGELGQSVDEVEALAERIAVLAVARGPGVADLDTVRRRLDALEAAHRELAELEE